MLALKIPLLAVLTLTQTACSLSSLLGMMMPSSITPNSISPGSSTMGIQSVSNAEILAHQREVEKRLNGSEPAKPAAQTAVPTQQNVMPPVQFRNVQAAIPPATRAPASESSQAAR